MKKRIGLIFGLLLGVCALGGICAGSIHNSANKNCAVVYAEPEDSSEPAVSEEPEIPTEDPVDDPVEEEFECLVFWAEKEHGKITVDKDRGHVGDIVTITLDRDLFYLAEYVKVNNVTIQEDEDIKDVYKFALIEGNNDIDVKFVIDTELLGEMSIIYEQVSNKDWTNLFSVENVIRLVSFLLSGGLLFTMVRYFIKDKKIANSVEKGVRETVNKVVPETTKNIVIENLESTIKPLFSETVSYQQDIIRVLGILVKCIALMQEDTPDSRRAILAELANLNIGDMKVIEDAKNFIDKYFQDKMAELQNVLGNLDAVIEKNKAIANKVVELDEAKENKEDAKEEIQYADNGIQVE